MSQLGANSGGCSSSWGGFMVKCDCGVQSKIRTVTNQNRGRKFRGCGKYPDHDCGFFDWLYHLYDDGPSQCSGCNKNGDRVDSLEKEMLRLVEKNKRCKDRRRCFDLGRAAIDELRIRLNKAVHIRLKATKMERQQVVDNGEL